MARSFHLATLAAGVALALSGCPSPRDNPLATCTVDADCGSDALYCYRGFCIPTGRDAGPMDAPSPTDAPMERDASDAGVPLDAPSEPDAPDGGCPGAGASCPTSMAGVCAEGELVCAPGGGTRCERVTDPSPESCNRTDDDCDGAIDESTDRACFTGTAGCTAAGDGTYVCMGVCAAGTQRCSDGSIGLCEGEVVPSTSPDGCSAPGTPAIDDDCDGMIDEDCACTEGEVRSCYAGPAGTDGTGRCMAGTIRCTGGVFGACMGAVLPRPEDCTNALTDDDCNGVVDDVAGTNEPCDTGLLGVCADGVTTCMGGRVECLGPAARAERCDGTDDDCDGIVDDGFDLDTSEDHCGGCGLSCGAGRTCCGGTCVSTGSDPAHCGDCPTTCTGGTSACCGGVCRVPTAAECTGCPTDCSTTGRTCCNGTCADFMTDSANCGGCGAAFACAAGERCCAGTCVGDTDEHCGSCSACASDAQCCGATGSASCVLDADPMNCRGCGVRCGAGQTCCGLGCSNLLADVRNCGMCGRACPGATDVCSNGLCCPENHTNSGGICCPMGTVNSGGICCATGLTNCGGTCVNLQNDEAHCGACSGPGTSCSGLTPRCCSGACALAVSCS